MKHLAAVLAVMVMVWPPMSDTTSAGDDAHPSQTVARYIECPVIIHWLCDRF